MKNIYSVNGLFLLIIFSALFFKPERVFSQCDPLTPTFTLDLSGSPNATSVTPSSSRNGTCCNGTVPCVKIVVLLNPNAMALQLTPTGADPGGSLNYEFNCNGILIPGGTPVCLSGTQPLTLTICKVGNNANSYSVTSISKPEVPDSIFVRNGCTQTIAVTGFSVPTINWGAINSGTNTGLYNSYLSCTSGCATVVVAPTGSVPVAFVDYTVSGTGQAPCETNFYMDTVRVYFYNDLAAPLTPTTICFGSISAVLSPTATGGKPAYSYSWSTGSTNQSIIVGAGNYTLQVFDQTGCPPITSTVQVTQFTVPITANAGPSVAVCKSNPNVTLNGSVNIATGGTWSGGTGNFTPSNTLLSVTYVPSTAEVNAGSTQLFLTTTGNSGCPPGQATINIVFQEPPVITAVSAVSVCANNNLTPLSATITGFPATPLWSTSGTGTFSSLTALNTTYTPGNTDINTGSVTIQVTTTNNGACPAASQTIALFITPRPLVSAGANQTICSVFNAPLSATISGATTTGTWSSLGDGSFNPNNSILTPSYTPGPTDINTGSVTIILTSVNNGNCIAVKDTMFIFIRRQATVTAGPNLALCSNTINIPVNGTITGATTTGSWSTSGSGNFNLPNSTLNNSYAFSTGDITFGTVAFTLTSTNNGPCPAVTDSVMMSIRTLAQVTAGLNQNICSSQNTINLNGNVLTSPATGSWSTGGSGGFITNVTNLAAQYTLSAADILNGFVTFTLTSNNNGVCPAVRDSVRMNIARIATVSAGPNLAICSTSSTLALSGTVNPVNNAGTWFSDGSGNIANPVAPNTFYTISAGDLANGAVTFTFQSTNNGPCPAVMDTVIMRIMTIASVNAGTIQPVCASQNSIQLSGAIIGVTGTGTWSASGAGLFQNPSSLVSSYSMTTADINQGTVIFTLTSTNNGPCPLRNDTVMARIIKTATVNAGPNLSICSNTNLIGLTGTVTGAAGTGQWLTSSSGAFTPGNTSLNPTYSITTADVNNGSVTFTLSSLDNGPCPVVNDTVKIVITKIAVVSTSPNQVICSSTKSVNLTGVIAGAASTGSWAASGGGNFSPSSSALNISYSLSTADIFAGSVIFTLTSTNNNACPNVIDTLKIVIQNQATVNAGPDFTICSTQQFYTLNGAITGITTTGLWSANGTGSFSPNNASLGGLYNVTASDIVKGRIRLNLISTNNGVCPSTSDSMELRIIQFPKVTLLLDTTICQNQRPFYVSGSVFGGSGNMLWTSSGTGSYTPNNYSNPTHYLFSEADLNLSNINLTLASINNGPCGNVSATLKVNILPSPKADFIASSYSITLPSDPIVFTNTSKGGTSYKWDFGDGQLSTQPNPQHGYLSVGFYSVTLITANQYGCRDTTDKLITVISDILFPNAFTPNLNGPNGGSYVRNDVSNLNDVFYPYTGGVVEYKLMIFNRWGELLFQSTDLNIGWDGYFNGKLCQQDAYVWKADVKFFDGRTFNKAGSVTLLR